MSHDPRARAEALFKRREEDRLPSSRPRRRIVRETRPAPPPVAGPVLEDFEPGVAVRLVRQSLGGPRRRAEVAGDSTSPAPTCRATPPPARAYLVQIELLGQTDQELVVLRGSDPKDAFEGAAQKIGAYLASRRPGTAWRMVSFEEMRGVLA